MNAPSLGISGDRLRPLDGLRGIAALSVFIGHATAIRQLADVSPLFARLARTPLHFFWAENAAVILFFVLSGFVLSLPYVGQSARSLGFTEYFRFCVKRIFRIYPAYWFALILALGLKAFVFEPGYFGLLSPDAAHLWSGTGSSGTSRTEVLSHLVMILPGLETSSINGVFWTIFVEMKASLLIPFLIVLFLKPALPLTFLLLVGASLFFESALVRMLPAFALGILLCLAYRRLQRINRRPTERMCWVFAGVGLILYTWQWSVLRWPLSQWPREALVMIGSCFIIFSVLYSRIAGVILSSGVFKLLGDLSYSLYLVHLPILLTALSLAFKYYPHKGVDWCWGGASGVALVLSLFLSALIFRGIEQPAQRLGRRVLS